MAWNARMKLIHSWLMPQGFYRRHNGADSAVVPASTADITGNKRFEQMLQNINTIQEYERLAKDGRTDITA